ncbi:MAG TPA: hypothetical protein VFZ65_22735 [Planctomycetota bacterium]|nr:hypothetical protein [Planctomycetota bacterium]
MKVQNAHRWAPTLVLLGSLCGTGCVAHTHSIGLGDTGTGVAVSRQYYFLFGFISINEVDPKRMAGDLTSYTIETEFGLVDMLLAPFLLPLTVTTRTVTVRT